MIIGLTGPAGCGKDTVADLLVTHHGYHKTSFADSLYREVSEAFGIPVEALSRRVTKELPMTGLEPVFCGDLGFIEVLQRVDPDFDWHKAYSPRQILQWWGTDYRRAQDGEYWVRQVRERIIGGMSMDRVMRQEKSPAGCKPWVVTDVRFQNEAYPIHEFSGNLVLVERDTEAVAKHQSEAFWATCTPDFRLDNRQGLDHLRENVLSMLGSFRKGECR
ncbi:hypothetical protein JKG47_12855 [Acidithiobacillus sp. MC6.1]|nr:hypothetical protein [Acidithiobacillus sp. MC6.1]